ncbi:MAG: TetR family transcriptional regulator [Propionibacterium sp.]|nr:TetR family transcriptional regulator [Propionibacterium sp.]
MGRPPKFSEDALLDAALVVVAREGKAATTADIAAAVGGGVGSLYYRFANREVLLLALWVRSIRRFQVDFLAAAGSSRIPGRRSPRLPSPFPVTAASIPVRPGP